MNVFMKKFVTIIATLMIGTPCLATDSSESEKPIIAKATARELAREATGNITPAAAVAPGPYFDFDSVLTIDPVSQMFVTTAEADLEDFKNMILVSSDWFYALTGTGEDNRISQPYPKKYIFVLDVRKDTGHYATSSFLSHLHQVKVNRGCSVTTRLRVEKNLDPTPSPIIFTFPNPHALTRLNFRNQYLGNEGMKSIAGLTNLEILDLASNGIVGTECLTNLSFMNKLKVLKLSLNKLGIASEDADLSPLSGLTNIESLTLNACGLQGNQCLNPISNLPRIKILDLSDNEFESADDIHPVTPISQLTTLTSLKLGGKNLRLSKPYFLSTLHNLTDFNLSKTNIDDLSVLASLTNLIDLELMDIPSQTNLIPVSALTNLTSLRTGEITAEFLPYLPQGLQCLQVFNIDLRNGRGLPLSLTSLEIHAAKLNDTDLEQIFQLIKLRSLSISLAPELTDHGFLGLTTLTNLQELILPAQASNETMDALVEQLHLQPGCYDRCTHF